MSLIDKEQFINEMNTRAEEEALDFRDIRDMVEFAPTVKAVPLDKVKEARDELYEVAHADADALDTVIDLEDAFAIMDRLIESEDK